MRCGYTIVPKELNAFTLAGERVPLNRMWNRRQCTKFNGTSYITQRGAEAVYSPEGKEQVRKTIDYYMANARIMRKASRAAACGCMAAKTPLHLAENTGRTLFLEIL